MSSIFSSSKQLALLIGLGASFAIAAGSLYYLMTSSPSTSKGTEYVFKKKKPLGLETDEAGNEVEQPVIKVLKEVPILIYEQCRGFRTVLDELSSLVSVQSVPLLHINHDHDQPLIPETVNSYYKYVQFEGYRDDVLKVCQAVDDLIEASKSNRFQVLEVPSNLIRLINRDAVEHESGAKLVIGEFDLRQSKFKTIEIIGSDEQIFEAYQSIMLIVDQDCKRNLPIQAFPDDDDDLE